MADVTLSSVYSFADGFVQSGTVLRVLAQSDELNSKSVPNSTLLKFLPTTQEKFSFHLDWTAMKLVAMQTPSVLVLAAASDGRVSVSTTAGVTLEKIGTSGEGPSVNGLIRDLRTIGAGIFAAGMGRQVYQRVSAGTWVAIHGRMLQPASLTEVRGFNAIHGLNESELLAGGWFGEIYRRKGKSWREEDSGTNVILNDVHITPEGTSFACGQMGTLLYNSGRGWQKVDHDGTEDEIHSLQWFDGKLYLATDEALFTVDSGGKLKRVKVSASGGSTFQALHANDGVLLSVGIKDIWWTRDARKWHRLD
jgi:hypothetical protein